jgi:uncharacterized iron-regulated membrane protein
MANKKVHLLIRRSHRYLGIILGIQFLIWTISGLYFSWTNIDEIHGDFQHKHPPYLMGDIHLISPDSILQQVKPDVINSIQTLSILQKPFYSINYLKEKETRQILADAQTGTIRQPVGKDEAIQIAAESYNGEPSVTSVQYITSTNGHHEYREKPLPAWAVTFEHPTNTTVYVSAEAGKVETLRNNKWRLFDFLWMGHTMDYKSRDNINNWLLRLFSAFGLITVLSGFVLYFISSKRFRKSRVNPLPFSSR